MRPAKASSASSVRVLLVTGRSGGHIFPALSVLERICSQGQAERALLVLPECAVFPGPQNKSGLWQTATLPYPCAAIRCSLGRLAGVVYLPAIFIKSLFILLVFRPEAVAGFGSLSCLPMLLLARILGIRTLIHEQNVIPGKANRFMSAFVDKVAVSFKDTGSYLGRYKSKAVLTGNPLRGGLRRIGKEEALAFFGFSSRKFTVFVTGGSQGSSRINDAFVAAAGLSRYSPALQVIHLSGKRDYVKVKAGYQGSPVEARVFDFFTCMEYAYSAADLLISRAGAITISEAAFFSLPAILVPYPFAYEHQAANARVLERSGSAVIVRDPDLCPEYLAQKLDFFISNSAVLNDMRARYSSVEITDAVSLVAEEIISLTCRD